MSISFHGFGHGDLRSFFRDWIWMVFVRIVGFLVYGFGQVDWTVQGDSKLPVDFAKVDYSKMFNNDWVNAFMMINVILGLFLLDRYFANKRKQFREEA